MILKHYWTPLPKVERYVERVCRESVPENGMVPDIGGSPTHQFALLRSQAIGWGTNDQVDLDHDHIGEWRPDFIYCRHTLEDLANPAHLLREIAAIGCGGYIETPSPLAELTRGVDAGIAPHKGYAHHRWILWSHDGVLNVIPKYPFVELMHELDCRDELNDGQELWNTHHLWDGTLRYKVWRNELDFKLTPMQMTWSGPAPVEYMKLLNTAQEECRASNRKFWQQLAQPQMQVA